MSKSLFKRGNINRSDFDRAVVTDTAPTDVPIVFSNDGFHANMLRRSRSDALRRVIFAMIRENTERYTIPYRYRIRLTNTTSRQLSLAHPAAQHRACKFYEKYGHLLPYFCRHDQVTLRRPAKIGSAFFYLNPKAEKKRYKGAAIDLLLQDDTVRNPGSFFAYEGYDRFYKFFNSDEFTNLEKTFSIMRLTDVSKCFSSIYSHTLAWAIKDVQHGKESTSAVSFANEFDALMQFANYNETNGIPVGAEVSRIFAEIILQSVEASVLRKLDGKLKSGQDFVIRRYIDDYIIFANSVEVLDMLQRSIADCLLVFNLHLNEAKTHTISRPLQTRKSQIISGATPGLNKFRETIHEADLKKSLFTPKQIREPRSLVRTFANDIKVACTNGGAGYEDVSPYIIGSLSTTIESLIVSYESVEASTKVDYELFAKAFDALISAMYYFFTVHATVTTSYQVAKSTILTVKFFSEKLPDAAGYIHERMRLLIQDVISSPSLRSATMTECVPIEMLNVILASSALPPEYRVNVFEVSGRVLADQNVDYFTVVALLFYFANDDKAFARGIEQKLAAKMFPNAAPRRVAQDAHFLLDLIACPYLSNSFRRKCAEVLLRGLGISLSAYSLLFIKELERFPWFVNWREIDLLNHLRRKELSGVY